MVVDWCPNRLCTSCFLSPRFERAPLRVFAVRVGTMNKRWDSFRKRYTWERFASAVWPKLPRNSGLAKKIKEKLRIAWPNPERRTTLQGPSELCPFIDQNFQRGYL